MCKKLHFEMVFNMKQQGFYFKARKYSTNFTIKLVLRLNLRAFKSCRHGGMAIRKWKKVVVDVLYGWPIRTY